MMIGTSMVAENCITDGNKSAIINFVTQLTVRKLPFRKSLYVIFSLLDANIKDTYNIVTTITNESDENESVFEGKLTEIQLIRGSQINDKNVMSTGLVSAKCPPILFVKKGLYCVNIDVENVTKKEKITGKSYFIVEEVDSSDG